MKIAVVGSGYVGLSNAVLLAQNNEVVLLDVVKEKVDMVNDGRSPIQDKDIEEYLLRGNLNLRATLDKKDAYKDAQFIIIATPTDYCEQRNYFNTDTIQQAIKDIIKLNPEATIVIKSTIPVGFVDEMRSTFGIDNIFFSPEFLREGSALHDNLYPSRIVIGSDTPKAKEFAALLIKGTKSQDNISILFTGTVEAEAVKLFANAYLAMRVAFFNELDMYAEANGLDSQQIILGASLDPRIGNFYNNPSFGYGGYCFPKDTKQLLANYKQDGITNKLIAAIVQSNEVRKDFIVEQILRKQPKTVGVYRLIMKSGSDNFRSSAIQSIISKLSEHNINIMIYEPTYKGETFSDYPVVSDLNKFKDKCDLIISNRMDLGLMDVESKVYTRDVFNNN